MGDVILSNHQQTILDRLAAKLLPHGKIAIALSGGVDSSVLLTAAALLLGPENVLAITIVAPMTSSSDLSDARKAADNAGVRQIVLNVPDTILDEPVFRQNPPDRCYYCKQMIFKNIKGAAIQVGFVHIADGTNADDLTEYRPGLKAIREMNIISPIADAGLAKSDVRALAEALCPDFSFKPAMACLATRIPHGIPITQAAMKRIDEAEQQLRSQGFAQIRIRDHHGLARVEIQRDLLEKGLDAETIRLIRQVVHTAGFQFATIDLDGYRTGSMQVTGEEDADHVSQR